MSGNGNGGFTAFLAAILLLLGIVVTYVNGAVFDSANFTNHALDALDNAAVRNEVSNEIANSMVPGAASNPQVAAAIDDAAGGLFRDPSFRTIVRNGAGELHSSVFDQDADTVEVQLNGVGEPVRNALQDTDPSLAAQVAPSANAAVFSGQPPSWLLSSARGAEKVQFIGIALLGAAALLALVALAISNWRAATVGIFGGSLAIGALVLIALLLISKSMLTGLAGDAGLEDSLNGVWSAFFGGLLTQLIVLAVVGAAIPVATRLLRLR